MLPKKPQKKKYIYLDNASTTAIDPAVISAMEPYIKHQYGNPSALYKLGVDAKQAVLQSRKTVSHIIGSQPDTIIFTSGGTESANMAVLGIARKHKYSGKHIITTKIEHSAVLNPIKKLETEGFDVTYLDVDEFGRIEVSQFKKALREDTILVSVMFANNEIGVINPIAELGREILKFRKQNNSAYPYFHTDACQAAGTLNLNVEKTHVDVMTINASKISGPKGVGVLYKRRNVEIEPIMYGGGQEFGLRSGTENVAGIVGFATAFEMSQKNKKLDNVKMKEVSDYFLTLISKDIKDVKLNGPELKSDDRLSFNLNVSFAGIEADTLVLYLDEYGIMCSKGSACNTGSSENSHVLEAIGLSTDKINGTIRFTISKHTTKKDIDYVMKYLSGIVNSLTI